MRVLVYPITLKTHREKFTLFLGGDFHFGAPTCDEDAMERFKKEIMNNRGITRVGLMGDYVDCLPKLDRRRYGSSNIIYDAVTLYSGFRDYVKPMALKVVACLSGNHDEDWLKAENIDYVNWLCAEAKMPYASYECYIRFKIDVKDESDRKKNVDVLLWHGAGGGRTAGGAFNAAKRPIDSFRKPQVVAMGHLHRLGWLHEQFMDIDDKRKTVVADDQYFVLTGGFLKGYDPPDSTYISRKMLPPVSIGAVKLTIQPFYHDRNDDRDTDSLRISFDEVR